MKDSIKILLVILIGLPILTGLWYMGTYNSLINAEENVNQQWAIVQSKYQRRFDLIPRIVNSTKMYINFERDLLTDITEARSKWAESLGQPIEEQMQDTSGLENVLSRLMVVVTTENYPELKSDQIVLALIDELEGTENRISVERDRYNIEATKYNKKLRIFPSSIVAGMGGFDRKPLFKAQSGADIAPLVPMG